MKEEIIGKLKIDNGCSLFVNSASLVSLMETYKLALKNLRSEYIECGESIKEIEKLYKEAKIQYDLLTNGDN
ncbi:MAG: hypothetical protein IMY67_12240 [Bacteroidetes bacterium]|nr:hypothetical protein [Bacteroidota bacterium]